MICSTKKERCIIKVMNIGIIIRNDHGDTFPVALTPQMVSVIQNLLTQIPVLNSKLVDGSGKKVAAKASIPIIPRNVEFDWNKAYSPMLPEEEQKLMKALQDKYKENEALKPAETEASDAAKTGGIIIPEGMAKDGEAENDPDDKVTKLERPGAFTDPQNPYNLELNANGRANVDLEKAAEEEQEDKAAGDGDCIVTPDPLDLNGESTL